MSKLVYEKISIAPLATFRVLFGFMMLVSILRFWYNGWIFDQYIYPDFFFTYYGFDWVKPFDSRGMYLIFFLMGMSALAVMMGLFYRFSSILFFLTFTYVELIDKTNYLNHYYFVSLVSFILIFLPAHRYFSLDALIWPSIKLEKVSAWTINIIKFQLGIVYFYAGLAKLNYDWLVQAMPLKIWLPAKTNVPLIGWLFNYKWSPTLFSWFGALYDLCIPFLLLNRYTRLLAYGAVLIFHILTAVLFQIGMFPYIMILSTLIFFPAQYHQKVIDFTASRIKKAILFIQNLNVFLVPNFPSFPYPTLSIFNISAFNKKSQLLKKIEQYALITYIIFQLVFPFRHLLYPGNLFWTEQGYRFSWRVMLMEKAGYIVFHIYDPITGKIEQANNYHYLTKTQEKQMSTQPDMILQFAHFLKEKYREKGFIDPHITAESYVTLNGRRSKPFIDPKVNLVNIEESWKHKDWVLPLKE